jgi:hypothetical protein
VRGARRGAGGRLSRSAAAALVAKGVPERSRKASILRIIETSPRVLVGTIIVR